MRYLLVSFVIYITTHSFATTYYVSSSSGNDANNGTSTLTPWQTIFKVSSTTFYPGDSILFRRGDVWKESTPLSFTESGTVNMPIVISTYSAGNKPVVSNILPLSGWNIFGNWIKTKGDVWKMTCQQTPNRLWLNGTEVLTAVILDDVGKINSQRTFESWFYDTATSSIYLYCRGNPAILLSSIEGNGTKAVFGLYGNSYITIDGIDFRGGRYQTVYGGACSYITFKNCNIGYGNSGLVLTSSNPALSSHHVVIENNTFDSGLNFYYGLPTGPIPNVDAATKRGSEDGIHLGEAVNNCVIRNNTFTGWGHVAINFHGTDATKGGVHNNKVYNNYFNGSNISYARPIAMDGVEGKCFNNEFYNNLMKNHTVRSQIQGNNNWVHNNIFDGMTTSPAKYFGTDGSGQAISMSVYGASFVCHDNKIDNNLFINTAEAAIVLRSWGNPAKVKNNYFRNNIFYNTGYATALKGDFGIAILIIDTLEVFNNVFQNNCIFNVGKQPTNAIKYYGSKKNVRDFNLQTNTNGNTISNNIQMDPMFINYISGNYHLQLTSPCIDSGTVIPGLASDFAGSRIYFGSTSDIGPYEYIKVSQTLSICQGQSVVVGSSTHRGSGKYVDILTSADGSDSAVMTNLIIKPVPRVTASCNVIGKVICEGSPITLTGAGASTYVWTDSVTNGVAFIPTATSTYTVIGTDVNNCSSMSIISIAVNSCTTGMILSELGQTVSIFPNPTNGLFILQINNFSSDHLSIAVVDVMGKIVYGETDENATHQYNQQINLSYLAKGMYYVQLNIGSETNMKKLIIQ